MKQLLVLFICVAMAPALFAQAGKVPEPVKSTFKKMYPGAKKVKWGKENDKEFEAEFMLNNDAVSANFDANGKWLETETEIDINNLPASIKTAVDKKFPGGKITHAEKVEEPGNKVNYEVTVKANGKKRSLEFDANGNLVD